jgi:hypothetical protein
LLHGFNFLISFFGKYWGTCLSFSPIYWPHSIYQNSNYLFLLLLIFVCFYITVDHNEL